MCVRLCVYVCDQLCVCVCVCVFAISYVHFCIINYSCVTRCMSHPNICMPSGAYISHTYKLLGSAHWAQYINFQPFCILLIHLNVQDIPSVDRFCASLIKRLHRLDVIINNAAQTVRRPPSYKHLLKLESTLAALTSHSRTFNSTRRCPLLCLNP